MFWYFLSIFGFKITAHLFKQFSISAVLLFSAVGQWDFRFQTAISNRGGETTWWEMTFGQTLLHRSLIKVWFISSCITGAAVMRHECLHIWRVLLATVWQEFLSLWSVIADDNMLILKTSVQADDLRRKRQIYNCSLLLLQNALNVERLRISSFCIHFL